MTEIEIWTKWESQIVNGLFPLRRFLGRSNHSVVFLTEYKAQNLAKAAIKLVPADSANPAAAEAQLSNWKRIATLSHPHLIRTLDSGRCKLGGHPFLFVVMEYAEQTLAQILPHRALTADEVREMLIPTLGALAYLHRQKLVQGQLKPPNFLVVNDQLKLASDTIRAAGDAATSIVKPSVYDPPEAKNGTIDAAGDVWGLGMTLQEALQSPPALDEKSDTAALPATLPPAFLDTLRRCLSRNPAGRPTIFDLEAQFSRAPQAPAPLTPQPAVLKAPAAPKAPVVLKAPIQTTVPQNSSQARQSSSNARLLGPAIAVGIIVLVAIWAGMRPFRGHLNSQPSDSSTAQTSSQQTAPQLPASPNPATSMSAATSVLHQEIPVVSRSARNSVHGQIKVAVLVTVDRSGNVVAETLENRGSSKYFARLAAGAAKKWRFAPAATQESRQWLLEFEFTRGGGAGRAVPRSPGGSPAPIVTRPVS
jgi:serine/threonine protein kinase